MELAFGALASLAPKLAELLKEEYVVQKRLKPDIESLSRELVMMHAALTDVSQVPPGQQNELDKLWARQVRELSYDMEDAIDAFMVRVAGREPAATTEANVLKKIARKTATMMKNIKDSRQISEQIKEIRNLSKELSELRARYTFNSTCANCATNTRVDPRILNLFKNEAELVGIDEARKKLIRLLSLEGGDASCQSLKIVSIVGFGGLGKTALARIVQDRYRTKFDCCAFVPVGQNPKITMVFEKMLQRLDNKYVNNVRMASWDEELFINELHRVLQNKRYFIVVDDIWDKEAWEIISCALMDNNRGSRIIITTRNYSIVAKVGELFKVEPLSPDNSKELFYKRICSGEQKYIDSHSAELSEKIIDKCGGIPLAIIAIASLLAGRPLEDWSKAYDSIVSGHEDNTKMVLLYSYYDLPSYLKPCLLLLSIYPEDYWYEKHGLIWMWVAEGFVKVKEGDSPFEVGERYFNELLNRCMIQPLVDPIDRSIYGCCVHDVVLDLIRDLSAEENFVTILGKKQCASYSVRRTQEVGQPGLDQKVRRLSVQSCHSEHIPKDTVGMLDGVRSLIIEGDVTEMIPPLYRFHACRVLDIESCPKPNLMHLGNLLHLRHLEIVGTYLDKLPNEIGKLKFLQTLILHGTQLNELPPAVWELAQLICLSVEDVKRITVDRMGNLVDLEELVLDPIVGRSETSDLVFQLGKLKRLRKLRIRFAEKLEGISQKTLVQSLCSLKEIKVLDLICDESMNTDATMWGSWEPPRLLWHLYIEGIFFSQLPSWIKPLHLQRLCYLSLCVEVLKVEDLENLGRLPELLYLKLQGYSIHDGYNVGPHEFKNLRVCRVNTAFKFLEGAMRRLEYLTFNVTVKYASYFVEDKKFEQFPTRDAIAELDFGLGNLRSLEEITIVINCRDAIMEDIVKAKSAVRRAVEHHPNGPSLKIETIHDGTMSWKVQ